MILLEKQHEITGRIT